MIFNELITPMNQVIVRDAIAQFLANERDNQIILAKQLGKSDEWIEQNIYFTVFPKRYRSIDSADCPCVLVYFDSADPDPGLQYPDSNFTDASLNFEMYVSGINEEDTEQNIVTADENADDRLNYLLSQVYKIFSSEAGWYAGTDGLVNKRIFNGWHRIAQPSDTNESLSLLGMNLKYTVGFEEPTRQITPREIKELYFKLKIQDEYIDPIVKILLEEN